MAAIRITSTTSAAPKTSTLKGIHYVDVGTSGGVWGSERGYCMPMIGGEPDVGKHLDPIFDTLPPGRGVIFRERPAEKTWRHGRRRATCTAVKRARALCEDGAQRNPSTA